MGALFAATVRAPITGIVLVTEMTDNYQLILPMMITTVGATLVAQWLGGRPIYSQILERTLRLAARQKRETAALLPVNSLYVSANPVGSRIVKGAWPLYGVVTKEALCPRY